MENTHDFLRPSGDFFSGHLLKKKKKHGQVLQGQILLLKQLFSSPVGIAFPTCVSVNNCICHYSPLKSDAEYILKDGDVVKL